MPANGELPVMPMTAVDEITYRTPDALFNGQAVVSVIQSCVPSIMDAWQVPAMDIDTILTAIRIASYGHNMDMETQCPSCAETSEIVIDLRNVMQQMSAPNYDEPLQLGELTVRFRPMSYRDLNENNTLQFEEQKILRNLPDADLPDAEKLKTLGQALKKITSVTVRALGQSIESIDTPQGSVNQRQFIEEWLQNCDRKLFQKIREWIIGRKKQAELKPLGLKCPKCSHQYEQLFTLDMASFFDPAS